MRAGILSQKPDPLGRALWFLHGGGPQPIPSSECSIHKMGLHPHKEMLLGPEEMPNPALKTVPEMSRVDE